MQDFKKGFYSEDFSGVFAYLINDPLIIQKTINEKIRLQLKYPNHDLEIIENKYTGIPYLSIIENLYIGKTRKKKTTLAEIEYFLDKIHLHSNILKKELNDLTLLEKIKLQLLNALIYQKKHLIIADISSFLSVREIQLLLPLLQKIAKEEELNIVCYTSDSKIANSPYIDYII